MVGRPVVDGSAIPVDAVPVGTADDDADPAGVGLATPGPGSPRLTTTYPAPAPSTTATASASAATTPGFMIEAVSPAASRAAAAVSLAVQPMVINNGSGPAVRPVEMIKEGDHGLRLAEVGRDRPAAEVVERTSPTPSAGPPPARPARSWRRSRPPRRPARPRRGTEPGRRGCRSGPCPPRSAPGSRRARTRSRAARRPPSPAGRRGRPEVDRRELVAELDPGHQVHPGQRLLGQHLGAYVRLGLADPGPPLPEQGELVDPHRRPGSADQAPPARPRSRCAGRRRRSGRAPAAPRCRAAVSVCRLSDRSSRPGMILPPSAVGSPPRSRRLARPSRSIHIRGTRPV